MTGTETSNLTDYAGHLPNNPQRFVQKRFFRDSGSCQYGKQTGCLQRLSQIPDQWSGKNRPLQITFGVKVRPGRTMVRKEPSPPDHKYYQAATNLLDGRRQGYRIQNTHFKQKSNFVPLDVHPYIGYPFTGRNARYGKNLKEGIRHARGTENAGIRSERPSVD